MVQCLISPDWSHFVGTLSSTYHIFFVSTSIYTVCSSIDVESAVLLKRQNYVSLTFWGYVMIKGQYADFASLNVYCVKDNKTALQIF